MTSYYLAYPIPTIVGTSRYIVRRLPNVTPAIPRITPLRAYRYIVLRCPSPTRYQRSSAVPTIHHVASHTDSTTRHVLISYSCVQRAAPSTIQSTIWWSERVYVSLVLPARGCLRVGGCRCTPLVPVVVIVSFRWMGRPMMRGGMR